MAKFVYQINETSSEERLDKCLSLLNESFTRSYLQKMIKTGSVLVNGKPEKASYITNDGDILTLEVPESIEPDIPAQNIPLAIVYEDEDVILVNKPKQMVVHPAPGHTTDTLVNALLYHCKGNLSGINGVLRPGIVHRIDMDTTGIIIACKNDHAHNHIALQLKEHSIKRKYYALVHGVPKEEGRIDAPIGRSLKDRKKMAVHAPNGKTAITNYRVLEAYRGYAWIECQLETGRTHQIRVHMASIGHPLIGDESYGFSGKCPFGSLQGQCLHAYLLGFIHPRTEEYMEFQVELPEYFINLQEKLRKL